MTIKASTDILAKAYPKYFDPAAKFNSLELWSGMGAGDVVLGTPIDWVVEPNRVTVITLRPDS